MAFVLTLAKQQASQWMGFRHRNISSERHSFILPLILVLQLCQYGTKLLDFGFFFPCKLNVGCCRTDWNSLHIPGCHVVYLQPVGTVLCLRRVITSSSVQCSAFQTRISVRRGGTAGFWVSAEIQPLGYTATNRVGENFSQRTQCKPFGVGMFHHRLVSWPVIICSSIGTYLQQR